jgi:hypothetical protein
VAKNQGHDNNRIVRGRRAVGAPLDNIAASR